MAYIKFDDCYVRDLQNCQIKIAAKYSGYTAYHL